MRVRPGEKERLAVRMNMTLRDWALTSGCRAHYASFFPTREWSQARMRQASDLVPRFECGRPGQLPPRWVRTRKRSQEMHPNQKIFQKVVKCCACFIFVWKELIKGFRWCPGSFKRKLIATPNRYFFIPAPLFQVSFPRPRQLSLLIPIAAGSLPQCIVYRPLDSDDSFRCANSLKVKR